MSNAVFFLRLSIIGILAYSLGELCEWAEIALYGISQISVVDATACLLIANGLETGLWRRWNGQ